MSEKLKDLLIKDSLRRWEENYKRIEKCVSLLNEDQVWKTPGPQMNSIGNLILHLSGNIKQYILSGLGRSADTRQRWLEFEAGSRIEVEGLMKGHKNVIKEASEVLKNQSGRDLSSTYKVQGFDLDGVSIVIHVTEHYSYHTGQIALLTKAMTGHDLGFYAGMDLNVRNREE